MANLQETWENMRLSYQKRYINFLKNFESESYSDKSKEYARGHMLECSYVLINVFGLSSKQVQQLEENYCGLTHKDLGD